MPPIDTLELPRSFSDFRARMEKPGVLVIEFARPEKLNALTVSGKRDLIELCAQINMSPSIRVVIFTGAGRAFCAGDDIGGTADQRDNALAPDINHDYSTPSATYNYLRTLTQPLIQSVRDLDRVTIAAINGAAVQLGLSIALSCDFRVAATGAKLGYGTLRFAMQPDEGGHYLLVQHVGLARALEIILRNRFLDADEAMSKGLVNATSEPDKLMLAATALAEELAEGPQVAMRMLKRALYRAADSNLVEAMEDIALRTSITNFNCDTREGLEAFRSGRRPRYNQGLNDSDADE
ncbi:enoyl-CoA hydratase/isomerase family protein [Pseudohaliea sp.]|uniref:enoyl-CoA hydratase/isomerase family protein n=1 Tax=Pseudohaliea sp. TaxID=2740289 RepID=UPI0032EBC7BC